MIKNVHISIVQDNRRPLKNGLYPIRLRVFTSKPRLQKLYPTMFDLPKGAFDSMIKSKRKSIDEKELLKKLMKLELHAKTILDGLETFSFENFEKVLYAGSNSKRNVISCFNEKIESLIDSKRISTAESYEYALKSIINFYSEYKKKRGTVKEIAFVEITPGFLQKYEQFMLSPPMGKSANTIGIYLRNLRHIFNTAVENGNISSDCYPFGKSKYVIPNKQKVKQALSREEVKEFFHYQTQNEGQEKAKRFWFFSYSCNGMNMKDIANLKFKDINQDSLVFYRSKIANTSKAKQVPVIVYLSDFARQTIEDYGNTDKSNDNYVFPIIDDSMNETNKKKKVNQFTNNINKRIRSFYPNKSLTFYWARHSFATNAIQSGASMEFVSEALSHQNIKTTQVYFAGFEAQTKKDFTNKMMDF